LSKSDNLLYIIYFVKKSDGNIESGVEGVFGGITTARRLSLQTIIESEEPDAGMVERQQTNLKLMSKILCK
jgi:hypothetical protein